MFLLVSDRHDGAHTDGHQHGVSIQISINLGKKFLGISRIRKIAVTRILARVFAYLPSFISQILDFIYWPVLIFILIYFELRDTENQQLLAARGVVRPTWNIDENRNVTYNKNDAWPQGKRRITIFVAVARFWAELFFVYSNLPSACLYVTIMS